MLRRRPDSQMSEPGRLPEEDRNGEIHSADVDDIPSFGSGVTTGFVTWVIAGRRRPAVDRCPVCLRRATAGPTSGYRAEPASTMATCG